MTLWFLMWLCWRIVQQLLMPLLSVVYNILGISNITSTLRSCLPGVQRLTVSFKVFLFLCKNMRSYQSLIWGLKWLHPSAFMFQKKQELVSSKCVSAGSWTATKIVTELYYNFLSDTDFFHICTIHTNADQIKKQIADSFWSMLSLSTRPVNLRGGQSLLKRDCSNQRRKPEGLRPQNLICIFTCVNLFIEISLQASPVQQRLKETRTGWGDLKMRDIRQESAFNTVYKTKVSFWVRGHRSSFLAIDPGLTLTGQNVTCWAEQTMCSGCQSSCAGIISHS